MQVALTGQNQYDKGALKYYIWFKTLLPNTETGLRYFPQICTIVWPRDLCDHAHIGTLICYYPGIVFLHICKWISVTLKYGNYTSLLTLILPTRQQWLWMFRLAMVVPGSDTTQARLCSTTPLLTNTRQVYRDRCSEQTHHTPFHRTHTNRVRQ